MAARTVRKLTVPLSKWSESDQRYFRRAFPKTSFAKKKAPNPKIRVAAEIYEDNILQAVESFLFYQEEFNPTAKSLPLQSRFIRADVEEFALTLHFPRPDLGRLTGLQQSSIVSLLERLCAAVTRLDPLGHYGWLKRLTSANRPSRGCPEPPPLSSKQLLKVGREAMSEARQEIKAWKKRAGKRDHQPRAAVKYRDGLLCVFLALFAQRIGELLALEKGTTFREPVPPVKTYEIDIPPNITKERKGYHVDIPEKINPYIDFYIKEIWPLFKKPEGEKYLWCAINCSSLGYQGAYRAVTRTIWRATRKKMSPHKARNAAGNLAVQRGVKRTDSKDILHQSDPERLRRTYSSDPFKSDLKPLRDRNGL